MSRHIQSVGIHSNKSHWFHQRIQPWRERLWSGTKIAGQRIFHPRLTSNRLSQSIGGGVMAAPRQSATVGRNRLQPQKMGKSVDVWSNNQWNRLRAGAWSGRWVVVTLILVGVALLARPSIGAAMGTLPPGGTIPTQSLIINEFMADNETTLLDDDGDTSDWIELYNGGTVSVNLGGWYLTDQADDLTRWRLPSLLLPPDQYLVIFASDKNRTDPANPLHTDFKLRASGEYLALVKPDGTVASEMSPVFPQQYPDTSYGLNSTGSYGYFAVATPGGPNDIADNRGPSLFNLQHLPSQAATDQPLTVRVSVRDNQAAVNRVTLHYRVNFDAEVALPMFEAYQATSATVFVAEIPSTLFRPGDMIRYRVTAGDTQGQSSRWPLFRIPDGSPEYQGTVVTDPLVVSDLPVFHWFVQDSAAAATDAGTRASVYYDGAFYDNVLVRLRGGTSRALKKKSFKFEFNDGYHFRFAPGYWPVSEINVNTNARDESYLRQVLAWQTFNDAGSPYSVAFPLRVQRNGRFYGLYTLVEQPDKRYFERQGLDWDGALYKVESNNLSGDTRGVDKKTRLFEDNSDLSALIAGIHREGTARDAYLFDNVNLPAVINFLAVQTVILDWDFMWHNHYLYRDTLGTGEWMFLPWDKDLAFGGIQENDLNVHPLHGDAAHPAVYVDAELETWNHLINALYDTPAIREMYLRRLRTLMDRFLQPPNTPVATRYFEAQIDNYLELMTIDAALDAAKWKPANDMQSATDWIKTNSLDARREHLYSVHSAASGGIIPNEQAADVTLEFVEVHCTGEGGSHESEYFVLYNPNRLAVDISGWTVSGDIDYTFQAGVVIPGRSEVTVSKDVTAFRARIAGRRGGQGHFVQGGYQGRLNDDGGTLYLRNRRNAVVASITFEQDIALQGAYVEESTIYLPMIVSR